LLIACSYIRNRCGARNFRVKLAGLLILLPLAAHCAALDSDALSAFQTPAVPPPLYAKVEHGDPLTLLDVVALARAQVSRGSIVAYLNSFGGHFKPTPADVWNLRRQGVSADLIDYITSPPARASRFGF
jgi:hypothetical protein